MPPKAASHKRKASTGSATASATPARTRATRSSVRAGQSSIVERQDEPEQRRTRSRRGRSASQASQTVSQVSDHITPPSSEAEPRKTTSSPTPVVVSEPVVLLEPEAAAPITVATIEPPRVTLGVSPLFTVASIEPQSPVSKALVRVTDVPIEQLIRRFADDASSFNELTAYQKLAVAETLLHERDHYKATSDSMALQRTTTTTTPSSLRRSMTFGPRKAEIMAEEKEKELQRELEKEQKRVKEMEQRLKEMEEERERERQQIQQREQEQDRTTTITNTPLALPAPESPQSPAAETATPSKTPSSIFGSPFSFWSGSRANTSSSARADATSTSDSPSRLATALGLVASPLRKLVPLPKRRSNPPSAVRKAQSSLPAIPEGEEQDLTEIVRKRKARDTPEEKKEPPQKRAKATNTYGLSMEDLSTSEEEVDNDQENIEPTTPTPAPQPPRSDKQKTPEPVQQSSRSARKTPASAQQSHDDLHRTPSQAQRSLDELRKTPTPGPQQTPATKRNLPTSSQSTPTTSQQTTMPATRRTVRQARAQRAARDATPLREQYQHEKDEQQLKDLEHTSFAPIKDTGDRPRWLESILPHGHSASPATSSRSQPPPKPREPNADKRNADMKEGVQEALRRKELRERAVKLAEEERQSQEELRSLVEEEVAAQEVGSKRKRVRIDDLKSIPARTPGASSGSFGMLDSFFDLDEDEVEWEEEELELSQERPTKMARTEVNVFAAAPVSASPPASATATAPSDPSPRTRHQASQLERQRSVAEKYKPKAPSSLREVQRMSTGSSAAGSPSAKGSESGDISMPDVHDLLPPLFESPAAAATAAAPSVSPAHAIGFAAIAARLPPLFDNEEEGLAAEADSPNTPENRAFLGAQFAAGFAAFMAEGGASRTPTTV
ncbi:hypothetical protein M8818_001228 [Zalaria obscura]|uniref:Uncharacterized protein n=1 Tax=Zalaria obscura TaxID=2024903 RepID=A0ACC3SKY7_9PEZI